MSAGKKSTPMRMCIACRNMIPKKELMRIVRGTDGHFFFDTSLRANGRGAYVCNKPECVERCLKKRLMNHAFGSQIPDEVYQSLSEEYANRQNS